MLEINGDSTFKMKSNISLKNIKGEIFFAFDCENGSQYNLNDIEFLILELISANTPFEKIVAKICSEYECDIDTATSDLKDFITELIENKLIE